MVCKLLISLYGIKQTPRLWYKQLFQFLHKKLGLKQIIADHCIFVTIAGNNEPIVSTFLNDIQIIGIKKLSHTEKVK